MYGAKDAANMLMGLARALRQAFRKTDLVARDGLDFWILAPCTTPETLTEKVTTLVEVASDNGLDVVDRDVAVFTMPDAGILSNGPFAAATDFLNYLKANRDIKFSWEQVCLPS
jgi:GGDEF domain-containing protein